MKNEGQQLLCLTYGKVLLNIFISKQFNDFILLKKKKIKKVCIYKTLSFYMKIKLIRYFTSSYKFLF